MPELTIEEKIARVQELRPIDDVFFEVLARNPEVMQEILRVIMENKELTVQDVIVQSDERNIYGRSVRLDALCFLGNGTRINVEVQRSDNDDHFKRVRFNEASITVRDSQSGADFREIPDVYVIYISEFDVVGEGLTIYHVNKVIAETGQIIDDGTRQIYVNTAVDDGTDIAELMSCFTKREFIHPKFPKLSAEVKRLKSTEGGRNSMSKFLEQLENTARDEGKVEGIGIGRIRTLCELVNDGKLSLIDAAQTAGLSEEDFLKEMELAGFCSVKN